jgi:predicted GIY-YIG superfamily endonuclease
MKFFYVYILQSESEAGHFYVGSTENLHARLKTHNAGHVPHTIKFRPWRIKTAIAFTERQRAIEFEHYLKTASGRALGKKRL